MAIAVVVSTAVSPAQAVFATDISVLGADDDGKKVTLCHRTDSVTNPYRKETISKNAALNRAANDINGQEGVFPESPWGDIIPAFDYTEQGVAKTFLGLNLTAAGQAILANGCRIPQQPEPTQVTAVDGVFADECGLAFNLTFTPAVTAGVTYHQVRTGNTITVTATANEGYVLSNQNWTQTQTDQLVACEEPEPTLIDTPQIPVNDPCDTGNAVYGEVPAGNYTYARNENGSITLTANEGYVFADAQHVVTLDAPNETNTDPCYEPSPCILKNQTFVAPWLHGNTLYPIASGEASYAFEEDGLHLNTPLQDSYVYGLIDAERTHIRDIDAMSYMTYRHPESTGHESTLPAYILYVDIDGNPATSDHKYFFYEPYYNGTVIEGTWQNWDAYANGTATWYVSGTGQAQRTWNELVAEMPDARIVAFGFNQGTYNAGANTAISRMIFDCATVAFSAGQGGEPTTPVNPPTSPETPQVTASTTPSKVDTQTTLLPETGASENASLLIVGVAMAALTYGAVYFAQSRRQYE